MAAAAKQAVELTSSNVSSVDGESVVRSANTAVQRTPSHGHGKVWTGWPDSARTAPKPSPVAELRDKMRQGLDKLLPGLLEDIERGKISKVQGADFLAKYGIGATGTVTIVSPDVIARLEKQATAIAARPVWETVELLSLLRDIWT